MQMNALHFWRLKNIQCARIAKWSPAKDKCHLPQDLSATISTTKLYDKYSHVYRPFAYLGHVAIDVYGWPLATIKPYYSGQ